MSRKSRQNAERQRAFRTADDVDPARLTVRLQAAAAQIAADELELQRLVILARQANMSWTSIAQPLGVTRQGARLRFREVDPLDGAHGDSTRQTSGGGGQP